MSVKKNTPKPFIKLNELVGRYTGLYANWKSSGFSFPPPPELVENMSLLSDEMSKVTTYIVKRSSFNG